MATAVVTALLISAYTVVDGLGVREAGHAGTYIVWMFFIDAFPMLAITLLLRRGRIIAFIRTEGAWPAAGGVMATAGYSLVLWAMARGAMAPIAALRETSVIFAAVIGAAMLSEPFGARRFAAASVLAAGLVLIQL